VFPAPIRPGMIARREGAVMTSTLDAVTARGTKTAPPLGHSADDEPSPPATPDAAAVQARDGSVFTAIHSP